MAYVKKMTLAVSIIGNGAIGGLLKARCQTLNITTNSLTRRGSNAPLVVETFNGQTQTLIQRSQTLANGHINDLLIIPVKAYQVRSVIDELILKLKPSTCLVMLHNGMGSKELIQNLIPNQPTILATTSHAAYKVSQNLIKQTGLGQSQYGWLNRGKLKATEQEAIEQVVHDLLQPSTLMDDMQTALWKKLAVNATINPLTAVLKVRNGHLKGQEHKKTIEAICQEVSLVAASQRQNLSAEILIQNTYQVIEDTAENYSSMYQDIVAKRRTELDSISGYIIDKATANNIAVPENKKWYGQIKALENAYFIPGT